MWSNRVDDNANKLAQKIIQRLLSKDCIYNSDEQGLLVNELSGAMYQGAPICVLYDMFENSSRVGDYLSISFVIEESKMYKNKELFPLIKKLMNIGYLRIIHSLLPYYSINSETEDELYMLLSYLSNRNVVVCAYTMNCISYILNDNQIAILSNILAEKNGINNAFVGSDLDEYMSIMRSGDVNKKILAFCSAVRNSLSLNEMLILEKEASCEEIYEFFYFYVLDKLKLSSPE